MSLKEKINEARDSLFGRIRKSLTGKVAVCGLAIGLAVGAAYAVHGCGEPEKEKVQEGISIPMILGFSIYGSNLPDFEKLHEIGASWFRPHILWSDVEPEIKLDDVSLTVEDVQKDSTLIDSYISEMDWGETETKIDAYLSAGITPFVNLVLGFSGGAVPDLVDGNGDTLGLLTPDSDLVGKEYYLGRLYLHARAVVRKFMGKIKYWQVEGELNVAAPTVIWGWRKGLAWGEWGFLKDVLRISAQAIKEEDPNAIVAMNIQATTLYQIFFQQDPMIQEMIKLIEPGWPTEILLQDIINHEIITEGLISNLIIPQLKLLYPSSSTYYTDEELFWIINTYRNSKPPYLEGEIEDWESFVDVIGVNLYPNYVLADLSGPANGTVVGEVVRRIKLMNLNKPIVIFETGYPSAPEENEFTEERQAEYIRQAVSSAFREGADGFFYFTFSTSEGDIDPENPQSVETHWGLYYPDGRKKLAWEEMKGFFDIYNSDPEALRNISP